MALRFIDSCDHYSVHRMKYNSGDDNAPGAGGRNGTNYMGNTTGVLFFDNQPTWIVGAAVKMTLVGGLLFQFADSIDAGDWEQVSLGIASDGDVYIRNGDGPVIAESNGLALQADQYYYIEFKATIHPSAGAYEVRVNGVTVLSGTGDTQHSVNSRASIIYIYRSGYSFKLDDIYVCDGTGGVNDTFLGDRKAVAVLPDAAGANSDWTGSAGGDHYALVDENPPTGDTDYVETLTTNAKETYSFQPITDTGAIAGLQLCLCIRKTDATSRTCRPICISGGTQYNGTNFTLNDTYTYARFVWDVNPDTGVAWTKDEINASEFGVEFIS